MDIWEYLTKATCPRSRGLTEAVYRVHEIGKRSVQRELRLCMQVMDNRQKHWNRDLNTTINIPRLMKVELEVPEKPTYVTPSI